MVVVINRGFWVEMGLLGVRQEFTSMRITRVLVGTALSGVSVLNSPIKVTFPSTAENLH